MKSKNIIIKNKNSQERKPSENKIQSLCFLWLRNTYPKTYGLCFHVPNGGLRSLRESMALKSMGVVPGIPDLVLAIPNHTGYLGRKFNALFIEMKTDKGRESDQQLRIHECLRNAGNMVVTCRTLDEFKSVIIIYLNNSLYDN